MRTRLYVCGPMRGLPDNNFAAFDDAALQLHAAGYSVFNPAENDREIERLYGDFPTLRESFSEDTEWICEVADGIALLPGWEESLGAQAEVALAKAIGIPHNWVSHWLNVAQQEAA